MKSGVCCCSRVLRPRSDDRQSEPKHWPCVFLISGLVAPVSAFRTYTRSQASAGAWVNRPRSSSLSNCHCTPLSLYRPQMHVRYEPSSMAEGSKFARGAWSDEEHRRFLDAMEQFPKGPWKAIAELVGSRSVRQVQTHAQQHHEKIARQLLGFCRDKSAAEARTTAAAPPRNKAIVARWRELEAQRETNSVLASATSSTSQAASASATSPLPSPRSSPPSPPMLLESDVTPSPELQFFFANT